MTPTDAVEMLLAAERRVANAQAELKEAEKAQQNLERLILPPLFLQHRQIKVVLENGAIATKSMWSHARFPKDEPQRGAMVKWLIEIGEQDCIKPTLTMQWSKGDYEIAQKMVEIARKDATARITFEETAHWKSLEAYVLREVKKGNPVPLDAIGAEVGDHVKITKQPRDPEF